jgi:hypothetical protein
MSPTNDPFQPFTGLSTGVPGDPMQDVLALQTFGGGDDELSFATTDCPVTGTCSDTGICPNTTICPKTRVC